MPHFKLWLISYGQERRPRTTLDDYGQNNLREQPLKIKEVVAGTTHTVYEGDARNLSFLEDESVHLVCTSPPYGSLKEYPYHPDQLGNFASYETFVDELDRVWKECLEV